MKQENRDKAIKFFYPQGIALKQRCVKFFRPFDLSETTLNNLSRDIAYAIDGDKKARDRAIMTLSTVHTPNYQPFQSILAHLIRECYPTVEAQEAIKILQEF